MKYIKGLNTLRAFAVFFVIIQHFGVWFNDATPTGYFIKYAIIPDGGFGVDLFFVLSGFLITSILLKAKDADPASNRFTIIKNFFARRALRIFPIYYILLFALFFFNCGDIHKYFPYYATYTTNILIYRTNAWNSFSHSWTLAVEEQFYLLWPWLMVFVNKKYIKYILFAAIFTGIVTTYSTVELHGHMLPFLVFNSFDAFGIGGLYAWVRINSKHCKNFERTIKALVIPALILYFYWRLSYIYHHPSYHQFLTKTVNSILSMWIIILTINNKSVWLNKYFFENRLLNYIGKVSYGVYLYHYPYIGYIYPRVYLFFNAVSAKYPVLGKVLQDTHYTYWIHVSFMVLIAALSFTFIEKPLLRLKDYFNYNGRKKEVATVDAQT